MRVLPWSKVTKVIAVLVWLILILSGCGAVSPPQTGALSSRDNNLQPPAGPPATTHAIVREFFYISVGASKVEAFQFSPGSGELSKVDDGLGQLFQPWDTAVAPDSNTLYIRDGLASIRSFSVDPNDGNLHRVATSRLLVALGNILPNGKFAYGSTNPPSLMGYRIDAGSFSPIPGAQLATWQHPVSLVTLPSGKFLYSAGDTSAGVLGTNLYRIDSSSGELQPQNLGTALEPNDAIISISPDGDLAAAISPNSARIDVVSLYSIDSKTGAVIARESTAGIPAFGGQCFFDPTGHFLYVTGFFGVLAGFHIENDLSLAPLDLSGFVLPPRTKNIAGIVFDPSGKFVLAVSNQTAADGATTAGSLSIFEFDQSTGELAQASGSPYGLDDFVQSMSVVPIRQK